MDVSGEEYLAHLKSRVNGNSVNRINLGQPRMEQSFMTASRTAKAWKTHKDRPEIAAALKNGRGESVRTSRTLAEQTYYYAARLDDGSVIRVASTTNERAGHGSKYHSGHDCHGYRYRGGCSDFGRNFRPSGSWHRLTRWIRMIQRPVKSTMNWPHWYADWKSKTKPSGSRWKPCGKSRKYLPPLPRICGKDLLW